MSASDLGQGFHRFPRLRCFGGSAAHSILDGVTLTSSPALTHLEASGIALTCAKPCQVLQSSVSMYRDHTGVKLLKSKTIIFHVECKQTRHASKTFKNELPHQPTVQHSKSTKTLHDLAQRLKFCFCERLCSGPNAAQVLPPGQYHLPFPLREDMKITIKTARDGPGMIGMIQSFPTGFRCSPPHLIKDAPLFFLQTPWFQNARPMD